MKGTHVKCRDWSEQEKIAYIKACIGEDMPHSKMCGNGVESRDNLIGFYRSAGWLYCTDDGMVSYDDIDSEGNPFGCQNRIYVSDLPKPKPEPQKTFKYEKAQEQEAIYDVMLNDSKDYFYEANGTYHQIDKNSPLNTLFRAFRKVEIDWVGILREAISNGVEVRLGNIQVGNKDLTDDQFIKMCCDIADNVRNTQLKS